MRRLSLTAIAILALLLCGCQHTHEYTEQIFEPTCVQDGYTEYTCACGHKYQDGAVPAAHKQEVLPAQAATCTENGLTEGMKCSACGEILAAQATVPAAGHQYGEWVVVAESTMTEKGKKERACSACEDKLTKEIPLLDDPNAAQYTVVFVF